ncbi:MAG TPA: sigma-54 dependent transcriptional regulator [bacterium]|nr:sigma-54 dependent transcriptional regulator [bacterium]
MSDRLRLLLIDNDAQFAADFALLGRESFVIKHVISGEEGVEALKHEEPDAVLLDLRMGEGWDGLQTLQRIREEHPDLPVVMVTDHAGVETAVQAMKLGALHYTSKKPNMGTLYTVIQRELRQVNLRRLYLEENSKHYGKLIGDSPEMHRVYRQIARIAAAPSHILIQGECGTGKEVAAHEIHARSSRAGQPFVAVDSGAIAPGLFESELFGHEKGAFTGADSLHRGRIEMAGEGTLFLDEITNLPLEAQAKLLRFIEERSYFRVGGEELFPLRARLIAATNRDLKQEVRAGRFRQDLYYRLSAVVLEMPPLRAHQEDVPLIAGYFLSRMRGQFSSRIEGFTAAAERALMQYHWPGNVRELRNLVESGLLYSPGPRIEAHEIVFHPLSEGGPEFFTGLMEKSYAEAKEELVKRFKREYLAALLARHRGNISQAACESGIARSSLHRMLVEEGIPH